ncbi:hypothetical protein B4Q45_002754 [Salmonella enterica subsp. enterica serovar Horsham]|nr:hypothetical protein [Salmonella enterica subsp. enterica serovar Horsham]
MSGFISCALGVQGDISDIRKQVISGDWSPINRGEYTLTDLGLRHNGNPLSSVKWCRRVQHCVWHNDDG